MNIDTEKIRNSNPLSDWLCKYGIEINRKGFAKCPFHNEKTASFRVYSDGTYHCFGCGAHGDVITFVMSIQNISFTEACELLDSEISYSQQRKIERIKRQKQEQNKNRQEAIRKYWAAFDEWKLNEDFLNAFKPSGPDAEPNSIFLSALNRRGILEHRLNLAENDYVMRGEKCG